MEPPFLDYNLHLEPQARETALTGWPVRPSATGEAWVEEYVEQEEIVSFVREYGQVQMQEGVAEVQLVLPAGDLEPWAAETEPPYDEIHG